MDNYFRLGLTHGGRVTHVCVCKTTIIGWDIGLSPGRRQAIISTSAGILLIGPIYGNKLQWNFNRDSNIFNIGNLFENVVCELATILIRPQCVNCWIHSEYCGHILMCSILKKHARNLRFVVFCWGLIKVQHMVYTSQGYLKNSKITLKLGQVYDHHDTINEKKQPVV